MAAASEGSFSLGSPGEERGFIPTMTLENWANRCAKHGEKPVRVTSSGEEEVAAEAIYPYEAIHGIFRDVSKDIGRFFSGFVPRAARNSRSRMGEGGCGVEVPGGVDVHVSHCPYL